MTWKLQIWMTMSTKSKQISISPIATLFTFFLCFCQIPLFLLFWLIFCYLLYFTFLFSTSISLHWQEIGKKKISFPPCFTYYSLTGFIARLNIFGNLGDGSHPTSYKSKVIQANRRHESYMQSPSLSDVGVWIQNIYFLDILRGANQEDEIVLCTKSSCWFLRWISAQLTYHQCYLKSLLVYITVSAQSYSYWNKTNILMKWTH